MKKKSWSSLLKIAVALAGIALLLAACSANSKETETASPTATTTASATPDATATPEASAESAEPTMPAGPVELKFVWRGGDDGWLDEYHFNSLRKKFPDWKFTYLDGPGGALEQVILNQIPFDIYMESTGNYASNAFKYDFQFDMSELLAKHGVDLDAFNPAYDYLLQDAFGGKVYYLPIYDDPLVMYYNKEIFDKFNVPYPQDGITWDEFYDLCRQLTRMEDGVQYIGYVPVLNLMTRQNPLGNPMLDEDTQQPLINSDPAWQQFFKIFAEGPSSFMADKSVMKEISATHPNALFLTERRMAFWGSNISSVPGLIEDFENDKVGIISFPVPAEGPKTGPAPFPWEMGISRTSENKDAAMMALKQLLSDEVQIEQAQALRYPVMDNPALLEQFAANYPTTPGKVNYGAMTYNPAAALQVYSPYSIPFGEVIIEYLQKVMYGELDINTALRETDEKLRLKKQEIDIWYKYTNK